ncbi:MAG: DUF4080 domain-containing protein [Candidatus Polarisedimenticolaceae bacterium]|nr:DUF4080 domain-containing protein [Candidatus Polarisedimenticolaceae bacterium]
MSQTQILLSTINARYFHASLGLRYLLANMAELERETALFEFTLEQRPIDIAEQLLAHQPHIIGISIYIWNIEQSTQLIALLKAISPETIIVIGGPEVSHEWQGERVVEMADYLICGAADLAFAELCRDLLKGDKPEEKVIQAVPLALDDLALPYPHFTDKDIANRIIYVEASRGCPFKCEFCLSALDKSCLHFDIEDFLTAMDQLYQRGVRHFKFTDRTFNLNIDSSCAVLDFFLERLDDSLFLHFEVIPDHLPDALKARIARFPNGTLQLEIGIQSFNPEVQQLISRKQDNQRSAECLRWLREHSNAHMHADLIIGLPGEDMAGFAQGFDQLVALNPHEIQVGILKRLKGVPIARHDEHYQMRYNPMPPYNLLCNDRIDFITMQRLNRFARYWEMIANSGRFKQSMPLILADQPFQNFMQLSDWLFETTGQTHKISLNRLIRLLYQGMTELLKVDNEQTLQALHRDFKKVDYPSFKIMMAAEPSKDNKSNKSALASRQAQHQLHP